MWKFKWGRRDTRRIAAQIQQVPDIAVVWCGGGTMTYDTRKEPMPTTPSNKRDIMIT
jgi:hypothetical protein